eukprot:172420-Pyramimonas_sp.AAC.1
MTGLMMLFSVYVVLVKGPKNGRRGHDRNDDPPSGGGLAILLPMVVLSILMFILTVRKIYHRWRTNQMEADIVDVV